MQYDEKNIRRRVYDALNVLMAMDIIAKEKKEIFWRGLPSGQAAGIERLRSERQRVRAQIERRQAYIQACSLVRLVYPSSLV
jgi:transcription factor Dp-1